MPHTVYKMKISKPHLSQIIPLGSQDLNAGDILQANFDESFYSLHLKDYQFVQFFKNHCSNADFAIKSDDDIVLNPFKIKEKLENFKNSTIYGCFNIERHATRMVNSSFFSFND